MKPDPAIAIPSINRSKDTDWLTDFRARIVNLKVPKIVAAIDERLRELGEHDLRVAIAKPLDDLTLVGRVEEAVRVSEEFLKYKHGRRVPTSRTKSMIVRWGHTEVVRRAVVNMNMSSDLELLAKYDRLDCAYEQIILDFPSEFETAVADKARANLCRLNAGVQADT